jgi:hypothetical protein
MINKKANSRPETKRVKNNLLLSKRSQNEIVGFVVIVVIVIIIGLFLLVFYLNREPPRTESKNVQNFLKASMRHTTRCNADIEPLNIRELTKRCYKEQDCNGEGSCSILNETFSEILEKTWKVGYDRPVNYYVLEMYYREGEEEIKNEPILFIENGNCTGSRTGAEEFFRQGNGDIFVTLEICYT